MPLKQVSFRFEARPWTLNQERRGSTHWSKRAAMVAEWRQAFGWLGVQQKVKFAAVDVHVEVVMKKPLADTGNAYGSVKAAIDGLVDAGVLPGDGPSVIRRLCMDAPRVPAVGEVEFLTVTLIGVPL